MSGAQSRRKESDSVFVTPIDMGYVTKSSREDNSDALYGDYNQLQNIIDGLKKDFCDDEDESNDGSEDEASTNSCSPIMNDGMFIPKENTSTGGFVQGNYPNSPFSPDFCLSNSSQNITSNVLSFNCPIKGKVIKTSNFMKKNWKNKLSNFKHTVKSKIMSKINFLLNNKINNFNLGTSSDIIGADFIEKIEKNPSK